MKNSMLEQAVYSESRQIMSVALYPPKSAVFLKTSKGKMYFS